MRVEISDVDPRDIEEFVRVLRQQIEYDPKTLADAITVALEHSDCHHRCIYGGGELYIIKGE